MEGTVLITGEIVGGEGVYRQAFVGCQPDHIGAVVDVDLACMGVLRLRLDTGLAGQQAQYHRHGDGQCGQQDGQRQQTAASSAAAAAAAAGRDGGFFHRVHRLSRWNTWMSKAMRQSSVSSLHNLSTPLFGVFQQ